MLGPREFMRVTGWIGDVGPRAGAGLAALAWRCCLPPVRRAAGAWKGRVIPAGGGLGNLARPDRQAHHYWPAPVDGMLGLGAF